MRIRAISLEQFRNYNKNDFSLDKNLTVIIGPNGAGKTNILEAISLLSAGRSRRVSREEEMVQIEAPFARVVGQYDNKDTFEVIIQRQEGSTRVRKTFKVNGAIKTGSYFVGISKTVIFGPEDIRLVAGSPARRREYIDGVLSQAHKGYRSNLLKYGRILKQRNKLLEQLQGQVLHTIQESQLTFWSAQLVEMGEIIQNKRKDFFEYSKEHLKDVSSDLYAEGYHLELQYRPNFISESRLSDVKTKELVIGTTQIGPHRDDFDFVLKNDNEMYLKGYGSRGQQRTGVLCIKVLELQYLQDKTEEKPILLLDDIFSELDDEYREAIESVAQEQQTIITTDDDRSIPSIIKERAQIIEL